MIFNKKYIKQGRKENKKVLLNSSMLLVLIATALFVTSFIGCDNRDFKYPDYTLTTTAYPDTIYADNNVTVSTIQSRVRDKEGFPVAGIPVRFRASIGKITSEVLTDEMGIASTKFYDDGDIGEAVIDAVIDDKSSATKVRIIETPAVDRIEFEDLPDILSLEQMVSLRARALDVNNHPVADGTIITFSTSKGFFEDNEIEGGNNFGYTVNGRASVVWNTGTTAGDVTVTGQVGSKVSNVTSYIRPGIPAFIYLTPQYEESPGSWLELPEDGLPVNFQNGIRIRGSVKDLFDNSVAEGIPLQFETTLGGIRELAKTNAQGIAYATYYPGVSAGTGTITATTMDGEVTGTTLISFYSNNAQSISFVTQEEITLDVKGVGGIESRQLVVHLKDFNGNIVSGQQDVVYEIVRAPAGVRINNYPDYDVVTANSGVATASLTSGTESGTVTIRVYIEGSTISSTKSNIVVRSGPPHVVQPFLGDLSTGTDVGGGMWRFQAGATVKDKYGNEVTDGTAVHFRLADVPAPPPNTYIKGAGSVGNESDLHEDGQPGIAFTHLYYHGRNTYKTVTIYAESSGQGGVKVEGAITIQLPLNQPRIEVTANPGQLKFFVDPNSEVRTDPYFLDAEIQAIVNDGQGNSIVDAKILIISSHGEIMYHPAVPPPPGWGLAPFPPPDTSPNYKPEYIYTLEGGGNLRRGHAYGIIRNWGWECPPPEQEYFTMVDVQVTAVLQATDTVSQTSYSLIRYSINKPPPTR